MAEILVAAGIVGILAGLLMPAASALRGNSDRMEAVSNLRQVALAVQMYTGENNGTLPGPLWAGQSVWYNRNDERTLGNRLWTYLALPEPQPWSQEARVIGNKAYYKNRLGPSAPALIMNQIVRLPGATNNVNPFGYRAGSTPGPGDLEPMRVAQFSDYGWSKLWMMQDLD
jgi:type II secretory pathway pseudopilin PulG